MLYSVDSKKLNMKPQVRNLKLIYKRTYSSHKRQMEGVNSEGMGMGDLGSVVWKDSRNGYMVMKNEGNLQLT